MNVIFCFILFPAKAKFDISDIVFEGIYFIVAFITLFIIKRLEIATLTIGWALFAFGLLTDLMDEFMSLPDFINTQLEGILTASGLGIIAIGIFASVQKLKPKINSLFQAEKAVLRRGKILSALTCASEQFFEASDWRFPMDELFAQLLQIMNVSRVCLFKNERGKDGTLLTSLHDTLNHTQFLRLESGSF
jgi:hypothetical protein